MKKFIIIIISVIVCLFAYILFSKFSFKENKNYNINKINTEIKISNTVENVTSEVELSNFSTKIIDKDDNRDENIRITSNILNNLIVQSGEEFSFNSVVGNPTPERGYKKAGVIVDGKIIKGYGGGNCQVSTTLYNAVKKIDGIEITERHEHGIELGYIEQGKDSTVAYDDLDFKFKNNTNYDIKLQVTSSNKEVSVTITKVQVVT